MGGGNEAGEEVVAESEEVVKREAEGAIEGEGGGPHRDWVPAKGFRGLWSDKLLDGERL